MQQLIASVSEQTGVEKEHVAEVVSALAVYVKEKYPLLASTVDMVLEQTTLKVPKQTP